MRTALVLLPVLLSAGCSGSPPAPLAERGSSLAASRPNAATTPPAPPVGVAEASPALLTGTVVETMDSGGYTYVLVRSASGDTWAAVRQAAVSKGAAIAIAPSMVMESFESKTLHRRFDHIVFGSIAAEPSGQGSAGAPPAAAPSDPAALAAIQAAHRAAPPAAPVGDLRVDKAPGPEGRTVAEVFAQRTRLSDKPVAVRGKVVKFLPSIMGRNWVHLRDGSGSSAAKDDDLTVTTSATAAVGEVVLVRGVARSDRDFGAGYRYTVIVEDATLSK